MLLNSGFQMTFIFIAAILNIGLTINSQKLNTCYSSFYKLFESRLVCSDLGLHTSLRTWQFISNSFPFPLDPISDNYVRKISNAVFSVVKPTPLKQDPRLAAVSDGVLTDILDMHPKITETTAFKHFVSGNSLLPSSTPLCHRYGGHQFGIWAGQLGDGRAHMLGEFINSRGFRWELQTKGSGLTPYSRRGDGKAVIRSSVREFLASEAMHYIGIPTSRAASLIISDDPVTRDLYYDGHMTEERAAVVLRLARSWFRFGSLEILAYNGEHQLLKQVTDYVIENYFQEINTSHPDKYLQLFDTIVRQTASMIAQWMSVGFAHGVCNTDNFSLLSITIDYGPFRFMDEYDPSMVPNTSDEEHRYSYENQPDVGYYNLNKLRIALYPLLTNHQQQQMNIVLKGYSNYYKSKFMNFFKQKLGLFGGKDNDEYIIALFLKIMENVHSDFTMTFRQLGDLTMIMIESKQIDAKLWALQKLTKDKLFMDFLQIYYDRIQSQPYGDLNRRKLMHKVNPRYTLRNWIAQDIITRVEQNNFSLLHKTLSILENPYMEQEEAELLGYADQPPAWASDLKVSCSS